MPGQAKATPNRRWNALRLPSHAQSISVADKAIHSGPVIRRSIPSPGYDGYSFNTAFTLSSATTVSVVCGADDGGGGAVSGVAMKVSQAALIAVHTLTR